MHQKVIFTGPTGVEKQTALVAIAKEYLRDRLPSITSIAPEIFFDNTEVKRYFCYFSLENEVKKVSGNTIPILLDEQDPKIQRSIWNEGWEQLKEKINRVPSNVTIFVELHLSYFRRLKRFILHDPKEIIILNPDCFVTLIDDAYTIYFRIKKREAEKAITGSYLRLQDILEWRNLEVAFSDCLARSVGKKNFIVPVKHPPSMLYRLIFERDSRYLIYASYPISSPRKKIQPAFVPIEGDFRTDGQKEIDENRLRLYQSSHIIFDPVCIDDRALESAFKSVYGDNSIYCVPGGCIFSIDDDVEESLNEGIIPENVKDVFQRNGIFLSGDIDLSNYPAENGRTEWMLTDSANDNTYIIAKEGRKLNFYPEDLSKKRIKLTKYHRWPLVLEDFSPMVPDPPDIFPLEIPAEEIHSIIYRPGALGTHWKSHVDTQIESRDFCFICNAEYMAVYRPRWKGEIHEGVKTEVKYAAGKIPRIAYYPDEDVALGGSPFEEQYEQKTSSKEEFYNILNRMTKAYSA